MITIAINERKWRHAYRLAIWLAALFFVFSVVMRVLAVEANEVNVLGPVLYFIGSMGVFLLMVTSGGALAPIAWYVLGAGIFFGLGSSIWGLVPDLYSRAELNAWPGDLLNINLLNSASILTVTLAARLSLGRRMSTVRVDAAPKMRITSLYRVLMLAALLSVLVDYYYFPVAEDLVIRSFQAKSRYITWMYTLTTGILWQQLSRFARMYAGAILALVVLRGVLSLSKTEMLYPVLCFMAGYWTSNRTNLRIIVPMVVCLLVFSTVLVPLVKQGRSGVGYNAGSNSIIDRFTILGRDSASKASRVSSEPLLRPLARIAHGPYQRYLINEYQMGRAGETLDDFWVALVPRVLWSEKPEVTRFGVQLHEQYNRVTGARSALAPTYSAEAYWNYGIFGVLIVSALMGVQFGWLSKFWFRSIQGGSPSYIFIAFPAAFMGLNVEAWIAASYVGGFVTLLVLWGVAALLISAARKK